MAQPGDRPARPPDRIGAIAPRTLHQRCYEAIPGARTWNDVAARARLPHGPDDLPRTLAQRAQLYAQRYAKAQRLPWPHPQARIRRAGRPRNNTTG